MLICVVPLAALLSLLGACEKPQKLQEETDYDSLREKVVHELLSGRIKPDSNGVIVLPETLKSTSINGQVLAAQHSEVGWIIAFPLNIRTRLDFLVYVQNPPLSELKNIPVGGATLEFAGNINQNWYSARGK